jgi:lipopolysaccharide export system permease protein
MLRILPRYMLAQFFPPFLFGLALFSGVLLLDKVFDLVDLLVNKGVSFQISLRIFFLFLPTVLTLTVPMAMLLACLLTFGRLSEEQELTALRASGLSYRQILWPPLVLAAALSALMVPFNSTLAPRAMSSFRALYHKIVTTDPLIKIEPRQFLSLRDVRLYADEVSADRKSLKNVLIYQLSAEHWQRIFARRGTARIDQNAMTLNLERGQMERISYADPLDVWHIQFKDYSMSIPFGGGASARDQSWREMSVGRLRKEIEARRRDRVSSGPAEAEMHLRFAIAFAPLALALLGIPLGITMERGGRGVGFGASLAVVFFYYLLLILGLNLAEKDALPAAPALWLANLFMVGAGAFLYRRRMRA